MMSQRTFLILLFWAFPTLAFSFLPPNSDARSGPLRKHRQTPETPRSFFVLPAVAVSTAVEQVEPRSVIPAEDLKAIQRVFPDGPKGKFIKGRYGATHYILESPSSSGPRKLVVMAHGLGTNLHVYDDLSAALLEKGYTVLRYDYFNHGFSVADDRNLKIDDEVMLAQVEDLLNFVQENKVHAFVGHSTGGVVAVLAAQRLQSLQINKLALVSPALWANKDAKARFADTFPDFMNFLVSTKLPPATNTVKDSYIDNTHKAFAKNDKGQYNYLQAYETALEGNYVLFQNHPFIAGGIVNINGFFLNERLLAGWRDALKQVATRNENPVELKLIFGTKDIVVDYESEYLEEYKGLKSELVVPIDGQGHESLYENTKPIADEMISFFGKAN